MKIATHNSGTGEGSKNFLHLLFTPFAKCQDKTIKEQYEAGVRYFDLRVNEGLELCHGLWKSNKTLTMILREMKGYVNETTYVEVTIERNYSDEVCNEILARVRKLVNLHGGKHVKLVCIARKKPSWVVMKEYIHMSCSSAYISVPTPKQYMTLYFKDWRRYIPIPRFLKKITPKVAYTDKWFTMVDFV